MKNNVLDTIINIPVSKPTPLCQCGTWSIVYPPNHTYKRGKNEDRDRHRSRVDSHRST
jgi:hypothetical protein